jgi:hypothetical protein
MTVQNLYITIYNRTHYCIDYWQYKCQKSAKLPHGPDRFAIRPFGIHIL